MGRKYSQRGSKYGRQVQACDNGKYDGKYDGKHRRKYKYGKYKYGKHGWQVWVASKVRMVSKVRYVW